MLEVYGGYFAGIFTSALWMATSLLFTEASRRLGVTVVNFLRLLLAVGLLGLTHRLVAGVWVPDVEARQVVLLGTSGIVGLAIGDQALIHSFVLVGPRIATLIMTTSPLLAALLGWVFLGERMGGLAWLGIATTLAGVGWVVTDRKASVATESGRDWYRGLFLAGVGSACQAVGLLLSKQGMGHGWLDRDCHLDPQAATLIRVIFAAGFMLPFVFLGRGKRPPDRMNGSKARVSSHLVAGLAFAAIGTVTGPYLGVWMSLVATDRAPLGIAQTLCSLTPIFVLPAVRIIYGEAIGPRAVLGACVAVGGVGFLFLEM